MDLLKPSYATGYAKNASQSAHPNLWDGLVGAWMPSLGVTGETLRDVSGNGNHGTFEGGTSWGTNHQERSVYFDGNDDWVSGLGNVSLSASQPFSVTAKVKLIDYVDYYPTIFQIKTDTNYSVSMFLSIINGYQGLNFGSAQSWYRIRTGSSIAANETNFFVITYNGKGAGISGNFSIFQNGVRKSIVNSNPFNATSQNNYIGTTNNSSRVYDDFYGHINSASIYNRVLSPTEIKQLYVDSLAPFRTKKRTVVRVPAAIPTATKVGSIKKPTTIIKPSYQAGYARNASESENPKLWDGLVGAWMPSLGVTGGTLRDVSGNENHGTLQYDTSWKTNNSETSLYFDGVQDHVSGFGDVSLSTTEPFSIVSKVRLNSFLDANPNICQIKTNTSYAFIVACHNSDVNYKGIFFGSTDSWVRLRTGTNFATNITQSLVILYNGNGAGTASNFSMYLDGKQINLSSAGRFIGITQNNYLGTANAGSRGTDDWHGNINSFSIYNRALSPSEIKQLYVDSLAPFRKKQRVSVAVPGAVTPTTAYHPLRSLAHPLEQ